MLKQSSTYVVAAMIAVSGITGGIIGARVSPKVAIEHLAHAAEAPPNQVLQQTSESFRAVAKRVGPAVVVVTVSHEGGPFRSRGGELQQDDPFWQFFQQFGGQGFGGRRFQFPGRGRGEGPAPDSGQTGLGSGFLVDKRGYIVTNNHVVEGASKVRVTLPGDEAKELPATVVGRDPKTDLAVLKIQANSDLPVVDWADSDGVEVGDWAVAIGSPFMLSHSVTSGIVSAKGRNASNLMGADFSYEMLQTDAAINPGNSGGPLCTIDGKVMGVNTAIYTQSGGYMGIGFAIPSNVAKQVTATLIRDGRVVRGWLGVSIQKADPELLKDIGVTQGVVVHQVQADSPALKAGLQPGDVIVDVDGKPTRDPAALQQTVGSHAPGQSVALKIASYQDRKTRTLNVKLGELPGTAPLAEGGPESKDTVEKWGLAVAGGRGQGVQVVEVAPGSPADQAGLQPGDVIESVNRKTLRSPGEFQSQAASASHLNLMVRRKNQELFIGLNRVG